MSRFTTEDEERKLIASLKNDKKYIKDNRIFYQFLVILTVCFVLLSVNCYAVAKTWKCKCGYENYVEIRYCGVCGRERGK
jgi:hypothetical protein